MSLGSQAIAGTCGGFAVPCSGFARLHCGIGVTPREGVAINLPHYVVIISVKLLQKLTVLCILILFKSKYRTVAPRSDINGCWNNCYLELLMAPWILLQCVCLAMSGSQF